MTAAFAFSNKLASYVYPFLVDTTIQYLNGRRDFKNEGYLLVSAFFVAKLVECLTQGHWFLRFQQIGIRIRALLVTLIYGRGLLRHANQSRAVLPGK